MKAVYLEKGGSVNALQYGAINTPADCSENQVLVRIKAIGINPIDYFIYHTYRVVWLY